ncbi:MAG: ATP-dependent helicase [Bacteroidetes bacterium]|nr:MAG: ATP-dependent helicase [Bacteroidota bacterium]
MAVKVIDSDELIPIEQHFRVSAGPGAGKTHWLINHIHNVLYNSKRLTKSKKIACITYTNIGVETILKRLGAVDDKVEVSTIHSFLYKHLVKPYVSFIASEYELNVEKMEAPDDFYVRISLIKDWISNHPHKNELRHPYLENQLLFLNNNITAIRNWLNTLTFAINKNDDLEAICDPSKAFYINEDGERRYLNKNCISILSKDLLAFIKLYWRRGQIHYDDVLFFSFQILKKIPFTIEIIRAKFPYLFIDEFQDTNPIQTNFLRAAGQKETIVGIIGDPAQSIYSFQGARPADFTNFHLNGLLDYQILNNRRSTNRITSILNDVRTDIRQNPIRNIEGDTPFLIIGDMIEGYRLSKSLNSQREIMCLTRTNINTNAIRRQIDVDIPSSDLIQKFYSVDSDKDRRRTVSCCVKAIELAMERNFGDSIKELDKIYKIIADKDLRKKRILSDLSFLLSNYDKIINLSLYDFLQFIKPRINKSLSNLSNRGNIKPFYTSHSYKQMAVCVKVTEEYTPFRTIHKAKGAEFDSVFLALEDESDLVFLLSPNLSNEEHRINYVALSRARDQMFISVPTLSEVNKTVMQSKGFNLAIISDLGERA